MKKVNQILMLGCLLVSQSIFAMDLSGWSKFADSIAKCTPGTFDLPNPLMKEQVVMINYQIVGMKSGSCEINISSTANAGPNGTPATIKLNCNMPPEGLQLLSKSAKDISTGTATFSSEDPLNQMISKSCKEAS